MATLELTIDEGVTARPAKRGRRLGLLFWIATGWMIFMFTVAILAPVLPLPSPTDMDMLERRAPFSMEHWLGTDGLGRDEAVRLHVGLRGHVGTDHEQRGERLAVEVAEADWQGGGIGARGAWSGVFFAGGRERKAPFAERRSPSVDNLPGRRPPTRPNLANFDTLIDMFRAATTFLAMLPARPLDENPPHRLGGRGEEMRSIGKDSIAQPKPFGSPSLSPSPLRSNRSTP